MYVLLNVKTMKNNVTPIGDYNSDINGKNLSF